MEAATVSAQKAEDKEEKQDFISCALLALECVICTNTLHDACETACGHAFCEFCINQWLERKEICPICLKLASPVHPSYSLRIIVDLLHRESPPIEPPEHCLPQLPFADNSSPEEKAALQKELGNERYKVNKLAEAIRHYSEAISICPSNAILYNNRAMCYMKLKQFRKALDDCVRATELEPHLVKAHIRKATCYEKLCDFGRALESYESAKEADRASTNTWTDEIERGKARVSYLQNVHQFVDGNAPSQVPPHPNMPADAAPGQFQHYFDMHRRIHEQNVRNAQQHHQQASAPGLFDFISRNFS